MIQKKISRIIKKLIIGRNNSPLRKGKKENFIFIHINKTGGTSIAEAIGLPKKKHFFGLPKKKHFNVKEVISIIGEESFKQAFVFCVVRNPWDKVVSHYKYRVKSNQTNMADDNISFRDWVKVTYGDIKNPFYYDKPKMFATQSEWIKDENGVIIVNNILRFESLSSDFENISKKLGITTKLPHLNATRKEHYSKYYDKETVDIVRKWFKEDIELFHYEFSKNDSNTV